MWLNSDRNEVMVMIICVHVFAYVKIGHEERDFFAEKNEVFVLKGANLQILMVTHILCVINIQLIFPGTIKFHVLLLNTGITFFTYLHATDCLVS